MLTNFMSEQINQGDPEETSSSIRLLPGLVVLVWWVYDLQYQWRNNLDYQFGWIVLMLMAYLLWELWPSRPSGLGNVSGLMFSLMVIVGAPFILTAELYKHAIGNTPASSFALSIGCLFFIFANLYYVGGRPLLKHFLFPMLFFLVAVPLPQILWNPIVLGLQYLVTTANVETLNFVGIPAIQTGSVIQLPNCAVGVDEACSGIRSLQSSIMAGLFIGFLVLKKTWPRVLFVALGILTAILGNYFRALFLSITANNRGTDALGAVHDTAGWSVLLFTLGSLGFTAWLLTRLEKFQVEITNEMNSTGDFTVPERTE